MKIQIVDSNDKVVEMKEREEINYETDIYRVSALWIINSQGKILLARRAFTKKQNPGKWGPAVAGTVDEGETYESNIIKETEEELGLKNISPEKAIKEFEKGMYKHFTQWFILKLEPDFDLKDLKIDEEEVAEIKWFSKQEIKDLMDSDEVLNGMKKWIDLF